MSSNFYLTDDHLRSNPDCIASRTPPTCTPQPHTLDTVAGTTLPNLGLYIVSRAYTGVYRAFPVCSLRVPNRISA